MEEHDDNDGMKRRLTAVAVASRAARGSVIFVKSIVLVLTCWPCLLGLTEVGCLVVKDRS